MTTFIIVLFSMIIAYLLLNLIMRRIPEVEAGPTAGLSSTGSQRVAGNIPPSYKKREANGKISVHRNFVVKGKCMEPKGISEGNVVDVKVLEKSERSLLNKDLKKDQIVLIFLNDERFRGYKLRIVKEVRDTDALTYYYEDGQLKDSSRPHKFKDVVGIVS